MGDGVSVWEMTRLYKILVEKPERKRHLGRHKYRWEDSITVDIRARVCEVVDWICLAQDRTNDGLL